MNCSHASEPTPLHLDTYGWNKVAAPYSPEFIAAAKLLTGVSVKRDPVRGAAMLKHLCINGDLNACNYDWLTARPRIHVSRQPLVAEAIKRHDEMINDRCRTDAPVTVKAEVAFDSHGRVILAQAAGADSRLAACASKALYEMSFYPLNDTLAFATASFEIQVGGPNQLSSNGPMNTPRKTDATLNAGAPGSF